MAGVTAFVDSNKSLRTEVNQSCGAEPTHTVAPIMLRLYENAMMNASKKTKNSNRHDVVIKKFASCLYCLVGKSGYELLASNFRSALPRLRTVQRDIASKRRLYEGEFQFDELAQHLLEWKSTPYVHIQLDDTRVINRIEYDQKTNRFVGFCLPLKNGLPECDAFVLHTFEEIEDTVSINPPAKYAHCIIAQPVDGISPSLILFVLGTDSKYDSKVILHRWRHIEIELKKRKINVISFGADGAGPFMKAMVTKSGLFNGNYLDEWTFYKMNSLKASCLMNQDTVHLLAKLKNKLLTPSNLVVLGTEVACPFHLIQLIQEIPKARYGLTKKAVDNKDKQNYSSIAMLVDEKVETCLNELSHKFKTYGTVVYITIVRSIRDATFDKSLAPIKQIYLMWFSLYFLRIWRTWLNENGYTESDLLLPKTRIYAWR